MSKSKSQKEFADEVRANKPKRVFKFKKMSDLVKAMNKLCGVVPHGNKYKIAIWTPERIRLVSQHDAKLKFAQFMHIGDEEPKDGFPLWTKADDRREFQDVVFDPAQPVFDPNDGSMPDKLNLWSGFGVEPKKGDWSLMRTHLFDNVCQRDQERFDYLMMWLSQLFSEPETKSGICLVLRGLEGVGKSKLGEWLIHIVGRRHGRVIDKPEHIAGKFNTLIEYAILVLVEEASFAKYPTARAQLNHIITNKMLVIEGKGLDAEQGENFTTFIIVTNEDWVAPVSATDRRYVIYDVGAEQKEKAEYFAAIDAQMAAGGAQAMLHDLLEMNVKRRGMPKPPMTAAKREQILLSLDPDVEWLYDVLEHGEFPFTDPDPDRDRVIWEEAGCNVYKDDIARSFRAFVPGKGSKGVTSQAVGRFMSKYIPGIGKDRDPTGNRLWYSVLPPLADARKAFTARFPTLTFDLESKATEPANDDLEIASSEVQKAVV